MLRKILPYLIVIAFLWYMPDLYLFSKNASNYIFKESSIRPTSRVEIKVVKRLPYLPDKYAVLGQPQTGLRVELEDTAREYTRSKPINDDGVALFEELPKGTYALSVGNDPGFSPADIESIEARAGSVFENSETLKTNVSTVTVNQDVFVSVLLQ